ncbi:rna-directed dna polymerase from mobile element jockey- hypothetical protein [Limosa lapponica baueri]|uniref:Reverse transcriptase domain-containing protein n=1 Tax=Limosa lapponica baueri TaxID=1758121 RepID=A0A2I0UC83_LIMLA|nr:rna-directed dna polymerase from mobile element jockey- hypothetical protein [Limosa lapponica baueri]
MTWGPLRHTRKLKSLCSSAVGSAPKTFYASSREPQNLEESEKVWTKETLPLVQEDEIKELLSELDTHKSWRTGEVPEDWRKANVIPVFKKGKKKDPGNYRPVSLTSIPGKMMERLVLAIISKHMEEKKAIRSSQHGFTKGKSCLTNLIAFYDGITGWIDEGRAVDVVYLDFSKAFDTVSHSILIDKLRKCGLEEWTVRWIENWLQDRAQRVVIRGTDSSWRSVTSGVTQYWVQSSSIYSSMTWTRGWSVPSASLLTIQNWEGLLTRWRAVLPYSETWTGWRAGQRGT